MHLRGVITPMISGNKLYYHNYYTIYGLVHLYKFYSECVTLYIYIYIYI